MPRFKEQEQDWKLIPVCFKSQILPGSFEQAVCELIDHELNLSSFIECYKNDLTGASAFHPGVLLKIILVAYSRGIVSSRKIEACCRENVLFMALSGDSQPHFTTIANFVAQMSDHIAALFAQVLLICDRQKLIDRTMFAIDGVKLPSNASKAKSGLLEDFEHQLAKMELKVKQMLAKHQLMDQAPEKEEIAKLEKLKQEARKLQEWLAANPKDRQGQGKTPVQSNRTDNESAKMATSKGVIQGYTGVAVVDSKHQIILDAQAHGSGSEQAMLVPSLEAVKDQLRPETEVGADSGYHSKAGLVYLAEQNIDGYIPDHGYRKRDERYATQEAHHGSKPNPLHNKSSTTKVSMFRTEDFILLSDQSGCLCPAWKILYRSGKECKINGYVGIKFQGAKRDCVPCDKRNRCIRKPDQTETRQVTFFNGKIPKTQLDVLEAMRKKVDSDKGKAIITKRFATVEPVFGNIRANKRMDRFTLRGKKKVDAQWKLYCLVHNIEKLANNGYGRAA